MAVRSSLSAAALLALTHVLAGCASAGEAEPEAAPSSSPSVEQTAEASTPAPEDRASSAAPEPAAPAVIKARLENSVGATISLTFHLGAPVNGVEALGSEAGTRLQSECSAHNMRAHLDRVSTQVVPVSWEAIDETGGGFSWEVTADLSQKLVLPGQTHLASDAIWTAMSLIDCAVTSGHHLIMFKEGDGVALPYALNAYTPNNPTGGFALYDFRVGVTGTIVDCDIAIDNEQFDGALVAVENAGECLITG